GNDRAAGITEHDLDALAVECFPDDLGAGALTARCAHIRLRQASIESNHDGSCSTSSSGTITACGFSAATDRHSHDPASASRLPPRSLMDASSRSASGSIELRRSATSLPHAALAYATARNSARRVASRYTALPHPVCAPSTVVTSA